MTTKDGAKDKSGRLLVEFKTNDLPESITLQCGVILGVRVFIPHPCGATSATILITMATHVTTPPGVAAVDPRVTRGKLVLQAPHAAQPAGAPMR